MYRLTYVLKRLAQILPVLLLVTVAVFALGHLAPGNPARILLGQRATGPAMAALDRQLGLSGPLYAQYLAYLGNLVHLNLGLSYTYRTGVGPIIESHMAVTLGIALCATVLTLAAVLPLAVWSAVRVDRLADHAVRVGSMLAFTMPAFWLGIMLILVFAVELPILPVEGFGAGLTQHAVHLVLPVVTVTAGLVALILRPLRNKIVTLLGSDFVDAAKARGLSSSRVVWRHVVPNALISTVTLMGLNVGSLLGGTVVVENVFGLPGLGQLLVTSVLSRDYPVVQGLALFFALAVIVVNLLSDLAYTFLDPRVSLE